MSYFSPIFKSLEDLPTLEGEASKPINPDIRYHTEAPLWGTLMNEEEATYRINGFAVPESVYRAVTAWYIRAWELAKKLEEGTEAEEERNREVLLRRIRAVEREAQRYKELRDGLASDVKELSDILLSLRMSHTRDPDIGDCVLCEGASVESWGYHTLNCPWSRAYMRLKKGDQTAYARIMSEERGEMRLEVNSHGGQPPKIIKVPRLEGNWARYYENDEPIEPVMIGTTDYHLVGVNHQGVFIYK